jgi:hypothetical protein
MSNKKETNKTFDKIIEVVNFFGLIRTIDWSGQDVDFENDLIMVYKTTPEELLLLDKYLFELQSDTEGEVFEPKSTVKVILEGFEFILIPNDKEIYVK